MTERIIRFGPWTFDTVDATLTHSDGHTRLIEPRAAAILKMLIERQGGILSKNEMADALWGGIVSDEAVVATIARLRRHLDDSASSSSYIQTIPKVGYRFVGTEAPPPARRSQAAPMWIMAAAMGLMIAVGMTLWSHSRVEPDVVRARSLLERGTPDATRAAEALLQRAVRRDPSDTAIAALAELYGGKHAGLLGVAPQVALARARSALAAAERHTGDRSATAVARGELELQLNLSAEAALAYAAKADQTEARAHLTVRALAAAGDLQSAARVAARATARFPTSDRLQWDRVLVAYLQGDPAQSVAALLQAEIAGVSRRDWLAALVWLQAGDRPRARQYWLRFYADRAPTSLAASYPDASPQAFAQFIRKLDRAGGATCADIAFAAAESADSATVRSSIERCRSERHPLAPMLHRYPLLRAGG